MLAFSGALKVKNELLYAAKIKQPHRSILCLSTYQNNKEDFENRYHNTKNYIIVSITHSPTYIYIFASITAESCLGTETSKREEDMTKPDMTTLI